MRAWPTPAILLAALLAAASSSANMPAPDPCGHRKDGEPCDYLPGVCRASPADLPLLQCVNVDAGAPGAQEEVVKPPKSGCAIGAAEGEGWAGVAAALLGVGLLRRRRG